MLPFRSSCGWSNVFNKNTALWISRKCLKILIAFQPSILNWFQNCYTYKKIIKNSPIPFTHIPQPIMFYHIGLFFPFFSFSSAALFFLLPLLLLLLKNSLSSFLFLSLVFSLSYIFFLNHLQITLCYFTVCFLTTKILSYVTTVQSSSDTLVLFNPHTLFWYHWFYQ